MQQIFASPYCKKFDQNNRIKTKDLSKNLFAIDKFNDKIYEWNICATLNTSLQTKLNKNVSFNVTYYQPIKYCPTDPKFEQNFQFNFYDRPSAPSSPQFSSCTHLPPKNYRWPNKYGKLPVPIGESAVHWSNMRLNSTSDLAIFNPGYLHNLYHFQASTYDIRQEAWIDLAAQYIPFGLKVRSMLEIGAGGGSISFLLNRRYDVTVVNTALPEFPYSEYITERGGVCMLLDGRKVLLFAKYSFDIIHHSLAFHGSTPIEWRTILLDQNRILRPGGYMWIFDGFSYAQLRTTKYLLIEQLGYRILYESEQERKSNIEKKFGLIPHQVNWHAILVKPNRIQNFGAKCH
ncbi:unnamed protein product [Rotaria magnacalcarata]|nr:unnamed protein product [Rotaria magnacalcarata]